MSATGRIGYLDCSTGVSGDKFLGALLDAGARDDAFTTAHLQHVLAELAPEARAVVSEVNSHGLAARSVRVEAASQPAHRHWADIQSLLSGAELPQQVRDSAYLAFELLADVEARAHGCPIENVHFHEVGALDSILDVVGTCLGVHLLGIDELHCSAIATGWGTVPTSHGLLPVPAPATATLLEGVPTTAGAPLPSGESPGELTTPTGAALVRAVADHFGPPPAFTPELIGYGAGTRDIGSPNVCRMTIGVAAPRIDLATQSVWLLETNCDHLSPEALASAARQLLDEGAADVWTSPIVMKKGRSAVTLSVLVHNANLGAPEAVSAAAAAQHFSERIVALTGALGVRVTPIERLIAYREEHTIDTQYGAVRVKVGPVGAASRFRPEADDVARVARQTARNFADVERELAETAESALRAGGD